MGYLSDRHWDAQQERTLRNEGLGGAIIFAFVALVAASLLFGPL